MFSNWFLRNRFKGAIKWRRKDAYGSIWRCEHWLEIWSEEEISFLLLLLHALCLNAVNIPSAQNTNAKMLFQKPESSPSIPNRSTAPGTTTLPPSQPNKRKTNKQNNNLCRSRNLTSHLISKQTRSWWRHSPQTLCCEHFPEYIHSTLPWCTGHVPVHFALRRLHCKHACTAQLESLRETAT